MKKNKLMVILALSTAMAQDNFDDRPIRPSLRTIVPLAITTLLVGSTTAQSRTCLEYVAPALMQEAKGTAWNLPLNLTSMTIYHQPAPKVVSRIPYQNCTILNGGMAYGAACCEGVKNLKAFLFNISYICVGLTPSLCAATATPNELACTFSERGPGICSSH